MQTTIYTLPEISFIGGETQELYFHLKETGEMGRKSFDAGGSNVDFAICNYSSKTGTPILSYSPTLAADENGIESIITLTIPKEDTVSLAGKFIYQITIIDADGNAEIPNQGIMNIVKNIHQDFILN